MVCLGSDPRPPPPGTTPIFAVLAAVTSLSTATEPRQSALRRVQSKIPVSGLLESLKLYIRMA